MGDFGGGVEAAVSADVNFDFLLSASALVEFLSVGVVPPRESYLGGRAVVRRIRIQVRVMVWWRREDWEWDD